MLFLLQHFCRLVVRWYLYRIPLLIFSAVLLVALSLTWTYSHDRKG